MLLEVEGFIMNEVSYGETSKIINVFTKEYGIVGIMCKGAKSLKNKYRALTLKLTYAKFNIYYKKDKLSTFVSADVINPLINIHQDIELISYLSYLVDLTSQVLKESVNYQQIYDDFIYVVLKIENGLDPLVLTNILEIKFLQPLGVGLNLDSCVSCGRKNKIVSISYNKGGFLCCDCLGNEKRMDVKVIKMMRLYYYVDIKSINSLNVLDDIKYQINYFLDVFYDNYTSLYLKSKEFLKQFINVK